MTQNIENKAYQLNLPGMENYSDVAETSTEPTSKKPRKKMDLVDKIIIWSSIGIVSLTLAGVGGLYSYGKSAHDVGNAYGSFVNELFNPSQNKSPK